MRFAAFEIRNYKGIEHAALDDIGNEPVVTISGRNGTGKSLVMEALIAVWSRRYNLSESVGPWADTLVVEIEVELSPDEWGRVDSWHDRFNGGGPAPRDALVLRTEATRAGGVSTPRHPVAVQILQNDQFKRENFFSTVDFLPANRLVPSTPSPTVDLGLLNVERMEQERAQTLDQTIRQRAPMALPSVSNYLVTLDYQAFLAERQGLTVDSEYGRLASAFELATGKVLLLPQFDPARGSNIEIELATGHRHGLRELSSGEQEMLAMMYFVRRLSASGGILCIDEPEQHLHPTLQAALFDTMRDLAQRAQVLVVSHSVNLIAASPLSGLVQLLPPSGYGENQVKRLHDDPGRVELMAELGITAADMLQSDLILVVEGDTDAQWLRMMFPIELGRAHVMVAGSGGQVIDAHSTLEKTPIGIPWVCLRDRDLLNDDEVDALIQAREHLVVWGRREIESLLLEPPLISAVLSANGSPVTAEVVDDWLKEFAEPLKEEVLETLVTSELSRRHPAPAAGGGGRFERMEGHLRQYSAVNVQRADALKSVLADLRHDLDERWDVDWVKLVDPKPMLAQVHQRAQVFKSPSAFKNALVARLRDDPLLRPADLEAFRARLECLLSGPRNSLRP